MDKPFIVYASRLMKGREVRRACKEFREQEAKIRQQNFKVLTDTFTWKNQKGPTEILSSARP